MKITTDLIACGGLVAARLISIALDGSRELQNTIAGGLAGYISKTVIMHKNEQKDEGGGQE